MNAERQRKKGERAIAFSHKNHSGYAVMSIRCTKLETQLELVSELRGEWWLNPISRHHSVFSPVLCVDLGK